MGLSGRRPRVVEGEKDVPAPRAGGSAEKGTTTKERRKRSKSTTEKSGREEGTGIFLKRERETGNGKRSSGRKRANTEKPGPLTDDRGRE